MQLVYRGSSFTFQPATIARSQAAGTTPHTLMYRGLNYSYQKSINEAQGSPKAMNWRFAQVCQSSTGFSPAHA